MCCVYFVVCSCYTPCNKNKINIAVGINYHIGIQINACSLIRCQYSYVLVKMVDICNTGEVASD
jgi:hypothetical protein